MSEIEWRDGTGLAACPRFRPFARREIGRNLKRARVGAPSPPAVDFGHQKLNALVRQLLLAGEIDGCARGRLDRAFQFRPLMFQNGRN